MTAIEEFREQVAEFNGEALFADGFEDAILGVAERCSQRPVVVYDIERCLQILVERDHMSYEDAADFFNFNVLGAWVGENTPLFLWRFERRAMSELTVYVDAVSPESSKQYGETSIVIPKDDTHRNGLLKCCQDFCTANGRPQDAEKFKQAIKQTPWDDADDGT